MRALLERSRRARRTAAVARRRPLRIALDRRAPRTKRPERIAMRWSVTTRPIARLHLIPLPDKPAVVSIDEDRTLRNGDAVMMADGLHVFRDQGLWPHRPREFVRLLRAASLDWRLRRTLEPLDDNPPTRWTSIMVPPA